MTRWHAGFVPAPDYHDRFPLERDGPVCIAPVCATPNPPTLIAVSIEPILPPTLSNVAFIIANSRLFVIEFQLFLYRNVPGQCIAVTSCKPGASFRVST